MVKPHEILIRNLRQLRLRHDLTQESAAELSGVPYKYYQDIEAGRRPCLRLDSLVRLAKPYSLGPGELLNASLPESKISTRKKVKTRLRAPSKEAKKRAR